MVRAYADPQRPPLAPRQWPLSVPAVAQVVPLGDRPAGIMFAVNRTYAEPAQQLADGDEVAFDRQLAGADPLHAVELAAQFASKYIRGRAEDEGGTLEPPIAP